MSGRVRRERVGEDTGLGGGGKLRELSERAERERYSHIEKQRDWRGSALKTEGRLYSVCVPFKIYVGRNSFIFA